MCTKPIEYQFSPLRGGYTFQATYAKSRESEINIYTTCIMKLMLEKMFLENVTFYSLCNGHHCLVILNLAMVMSTGYSLCNGYHCLVNLNLAMVMSTGYVTGICSIKPVLVYFCLFKRQQSISK